ncbi:MAG: bifunctional oligoribonuclease/PAP phosphatase NrnA [Nitrospinota bacterium]|nr:MAG: bifunctional oligoribonuclease/PAP phosphatase NrnA [Nitrospinota bacterium]
MDASSSRSLSAIEREIVTFLQEAGADNLLITSHVNPDGDGIAAMLAFGKIAQFLGKRYGILVDGTPSTRLNFLVDFSTIQSLNGNPLTFTPEVLVVLDCPELDRIGKVKTLLPSQVSIINIDHHPGNARFGRFNLVDPQASASTEVLYSLCKAFRLPLDTALATQIYTGIVFDTGRFRYSRVTSKTLRLCAELLQQSDLDVQMVAERLFYDHSFATLKLLGVALQQLEMHYGGKVAVMYLDHATLNRPEFRDADTEGFVDYTISITGVEVGMLFQEYEPEKIRISLRSRGPFDVQAIAKQFGGGGHKKAAGCRQQGKLAIVMARVLEEVQQRLITS